MPETNRLYCCTLYCITAYYIVSISHFFFAITFMHVIAIRLLYLKISLLMAANSRIFSFKCIKHKPSDSHHKMASYILSQIPCRTLSHSIFFQFFLNKRANKMFNFLYDSNTPNSFKLKKKQNTSHYT